MPVLLSEKQAVVYFALTFDTIVELPIRQAQVENYVGMGKLTWDDFLSPRSGRLMSARVMTENDPTKT